MTYAGDMAIDYITDTFSKDFLDRLSVREYFQIVNVYIAGYEQGKAEMIAEHIKEETER